jgi:hypothetical protein
MECSVPRKQLAPRNNRHPSPPDKRKTPSPPPTGQPEPLPNWQNHQEFIEADREGKEIEKRMSAFAAKPSRKVLLKEKVEELEVELKELQSELEETRDELARDSSERQNKEDAVRLEVVRARIERASKGIGKQAEKEDGSKSYPWRLLLGAS